MTAEAKIQVGPGLPTLLFLIFLTLKLTNGIDWSWWWVTAPLWISGAIAFILVTILLVFAFMFPNKMDRNLEKMLQKYDN